MLAAAAAALALPAAAETGDAECEAEVGLLKKIGREMAKREVTVGAGVAVAPKYEGGSSLDVEPAPFFDFELRIAPHLLLSMDGLSLEFGDEEDGLWHATAALGWAEGRDESDASILRGMGDIHDAAALSAEVGGGIGLLEAYAGMSRSLGGTDGLDGTLGLRAYLPLGGDDEDDEDSDEIGAGCVLLALDLSGTWADANEMDALFGVSPKQSARSGHPEYRAGGGFKRFDVSLESTWFVTENWMLVASAGVGVLDGRLKRSPIVRERLQPEFSLGVVWRF